MPVIKHPASVRTARHWTIRSELELQEQPHAVCLCRKHQSKVLPLSCAARYRTPEDHRLPDAASHAMRRSDRPSSDLPRCWDALSRILRLLVSLAHLRPLIVLAWVARKFPNGEAELHLLRYAAPTLSSGSAKSLIGKVECEFDRGNSPGSSAHKRFQDRLATSEPNDSVHGT